MVSNLEGKKILLGVTGSIAAYKSAFLIRLLVKKGAMVNVVMTSTAKDFISPLTLSTLSKNPVHTEVSAEDSWNNHVEMGLWADAMLIAPMTANTMAKLANGLCDSMVAATYLSAKCPVFFAPAMDLDMWKHPATKKNLEQLLSYGNHLIPVGHGELASGLVGEGRMAEPEDITMFLEDFFSNEKTLKGKKFLVTAGPTYEPLDPVRFIGNHSSGKMGIAIAEIAAKRGGEVVLVLGPSKLNTSHPNVEVINVQTAHEMCEAALLHYPTSDVGILAAAVADYRPKFKSDKKIKKKEGELFIELERTTDIAQTLGKQKKSNQKLIGFALETNDELENAKRKLVKKNFDFIVLNSLKDKGAGFKHDTNKITIVHNDNNVRIFELKSKVEVAKDIINEVERLD